METHAIGAISNSERIRRGAERRGYAPVESLICATTCGPRAVHGPGGTDPADLSESIERLDRREWNQSGHRGPTGQGNAKMVSLSTQDMMRAPGMTFIQHHRTRHLQMKVRFSRWDEILAEPRPAADAHDRARWVGDQYLCA
jgi:hypothetical protein